MTLGLPVLASAAMPVFAAQTEITQTSRCRVLTRHVPDADVAYLPGHDVVAGKPVAPADLPADLEAAEAPLSVPQNFAIEIDADLAANVAGPQGPASYLPRAKIGRVEVTDLQGETVLSFNGQKLYRGGPQIASPECAE